ncbi:MAG: response regulator [Myxococcales bacterium]|nr:response regulator [Myxococcales bacterium]
MTSAAAPDDVTPRARILVVDDEPQILGLIERILRGPRYEVVAAGSVDDALARLADTPVDVILSDFAMPNRNGWQLYQAVLADHPHLAPRFAFVTAVMPELPAHARAPVLTKPFNREGLLALVAELVAR